MISKKKPIAKNEPRDGPKNGAASKAGKRKSPHHKDAGQAEKEKAGSGQTFPAGSENGYGVTAFTIPILP